MMRRWVRKRKGVLARDSLEQLLDVDVTLIYRAMQKSKEDEIKNKTNARREDARRGAV
jgi:hypothetical protein